MKIKPIVTAIAMAGAFSASAVTVSEAGLATKDWSTAQLEAVTQIKQLNINSSKNKFKTADQRAAQDKYFEQNAHEGVKRYIVRLKDSAVPSYRGGVAGLDAVNMTAAKSGLNTIEFNSKSDAAKAYVNYLDQKQDSFIQKASSKLGGKIDELRRFKYALNGIVTDLSFEQAKQLAKMPEVAFIEQEEILQLNTDTGPAFIGADEVWDGTTTGSELRGEGIIVGILDTGVNTDHPSFAAVGGDGYAHTNPFGDDVYVGDCVADASLCNDKLIGVRSYSIITDSYSDGDTFDPADQRPPSGEDYNGHGSHTASTTGGNVLLDVPYMVNDFLAGNPSDGQALAYTFTSMSGVAPHANVISYQVCWPGNSGDTYSGCPEAATIAAIDDAIADGVDVINFSIGGGLPNPWNDASELAWLNANSAGIFVATSAGNSGPDAYTTSKGSPWYTSVAASNHGNAGVSGDGLTIGSFAGGDTAPPADITGGGTNGDFTGDVVYAGDFANPNDPDNDSAQCLQPFPAATFTATQIVVCDRGSIARVSKAANAAAGGAGGFVLANLQGGATSIADDHYAVPGVHISADDGDVLKAWLASGAGHTGTIGSVTLSRATNTADQIAGFSSRGPNVHAEVITPQIAAPGVSIYAANADDQPFNDQTGGFPVDYAFLSGTSMASPHVAGSGALVKQAHSTWTPDQIRSALMMTSTTAMVKEDGATPADMWDMGAGRVQVNQAINAGLLMSESEANYLAANPADGGDPKTLNVPSMANFACGSSCSWTRTFTAVTAGTYTVTTSNAALTAEPASFDAVVGENYSVTFTLDVSDQSTGNELIEQVDITSAGLPDLHLPVYVTVNNGSVPDSVNIVAGRNDGAWELDGLQSIPTDNLTFVIDGLFDANAVGFAATEDFDIAVDPTNDVYNDDLSQVFVYEFEVAPNSVSMSVSISGATSPDFDLYVDYSAAGDGNYVNVAASATGDTNESVNIDAPPAGTYRAIVQNWTSPNASDTGTLNVSVVPQTDPVAGITIDAPNSTNGIDPLNARLLWDIEMASGDAYTADITMMAGDLEVGTFPVRLERGADDVVGTSTDDQVSRGENIEYTVTINPNNYNRDVEYDVSIDMPSNMSLVDGSITSSAGAVVLKDPDATGLDITGEFDIAEDPSNDDPIDNLTQVYVNEFEVISGTLVLNAEITETTSPDLDLFVYRDSAGNGTFAELVDFSATAGTLERVSVDTPVPGAYRVVVQNWAGSAAATDTGTLRVTSDVAVGEGFIWSVTAEMPQPTYSVVSSVDSTTCANAGLGGWAGSPGYVPLSAFAIGTIGISGDEIGISAFTDRTFPIFGNTRSGMTISDNGFVNFSGGLGANAWNDLPIPNAAEPNDMLAGWWQDQIIEDDGTRGLRLANLGPMALVDFDGTESWTNDGSSTDRFKYMIQVFDSIQNEGDAFGPYELIVSYANDQVGDFTVATAGVENPDGSLGVDASAMVAPGVQLCYDATEVVDSYTVTFSVTPTADFVGSTAAPEVSFETDMAGTTALTVEGEQVALTNVGPIADAGEDRTVDRADEVQVLLNASGSSDLDRNPMSFIWTQTAGATVDLHAVGTARAFFNTSEVENGTFSFSVSVTDGEFTSTDEVTITVEGTEAGGTGSMGLLLLLGLPLFFRRRYLK